MDHRIALPAAAIAAALFVGPAPAFAWQAAEETEAAASRIEIAFDPESTADMSAAERREVERTIRSATEHVAALLPGFPERMGFEVRIVERDLGVVDGVSGRADRPGHITIELSRVYPGGIAAASGRGLRAMLYHELHHQARGWTIEDNRFGPGIDIAIANEGLATVFSELFTGVIQEGNRYPPDVREWVDEIVALPRDADYGEWMFAHPDGRQAIGYKSGRYLVYRALERSGLSIIELSGLPPAEIYRLADIPHAIPQD